LSFNTPTFPTINPTFVYNIHLTEQLIFELHIVDHDSSVIPNMSFLPTIKVLNGNKQKTLQIGFDARIYESFASSQIFISSQVPKYFFSSNQILFSFYYQFKIFNLKHYHFSDHIFNHILYHNGMTSLIHFTPKIFKKNFFRKLIEALIFKQLFSQYEFRIHLFIDLLHKYARLLARMFADQQETLRFRELFAEPKFFKKYHFLSALFTTYVNWTS
jgi:hypothetical protein